MLDGLLLSAQARYQLDSRRARQVWCRPVQLPLRCHRAPQMLYPVGKGVSGYYLPADAAVSNTATDTIKPATARYLQQLTYERYDNTTNL